MRNVIRVGDATSHGGKVVKVSASHVAVGGLPVACVGDTCSCPIQGHDQCTIVEGNPNHVVDGVAVAYDGHKTTCGATLVASIENFSAEE